MTVKKIPDILKITARELRKNQTKAEKILWDQIRNRKIKWIKFLRQYPLYVFTENSWLDRFIIPDFISKEQKLIIEVDGSIHNLEEIYLLDLEKEKILKDLWYKILRFRNEEIYNNIDKVLEKIVASFS